MAQLLGEHGFTIVSDDDLLTIAQRIGSPTTHERSLRNGRVATADRS